jgi:serpin B
MKTVWICHAIAASVLIAYLTTLLLFPTLSHANEMESVAPSINAFALDLYGELLKESDGNVLFSPFSISTALAMTWAGAGGKTAEEMAATLHFAGEPEKTHRGFHLLTENLEQHAGDNAMEVLVSNALWTDERYPLVPRFEQTVSSFYKAMIGPVSYQSEYLEETRKHINERVECDTRGGIPELLQQGDLDVSTMLVLTNAIYFKGNWLSQFDPQEISDEPFYLGGDVIVQVPTMHQTFTKQICRYFKGDNFQVLELPYAGGDLTMVIFLPDERDGLAKLEQILTANMKEALSGLTTLAEPLILALPKMDFRYRALLNKALISLGMPTAFTAEADFHNMFVRGGAMIDKVIHEAKITVNEEGTTAAGATAIVMRKISAPKNFRVDHPFLFLIRDTRTDAILFMGRVTNPLQ